ncbi:helix-turn-helix domain-containing protein [Variovorax sp. GT1P44]|uniref:helix-turn-helix domain-containing protein n=1 Tax=Variovorax sp. GT1P44 TaxID=3443742 RepID=UPI003F480D92
MASAPLRTDIGPTVDLVGAADLMKVHPKTVQDLISAGALPAGRIGRSYVLLTKDVMAHIERVIIEQTAARMRVPGLRTKLPSARAARCAEALGSAQQMRFPAKPPEVSAQTHAPADVAQMRSAFRT